MTDGMRAFYAGRRALVRTVAVALVAVGGSTLAGCEGLFEAENPGAITEDKLGGAATIDPLLNGAIGQFDDAHDEAVEVAGLLSDELIASGSWPTWHNIDKLGTISLDPTAAGNITEPMWDNFQEARFLAEETYRRIEALTDNPSSDPRAAMARLYSGLSYYNFGDYFCRAAYDLGPAVDPEDSFQLAKQHFSEAITIAQSAGVDSIVYMARLGRARAQLMLDEPSAALEDARQVPEGFRWVAHFQNTSGERQGTWGTINQRGEATIGLVYRETGDPRVPVEWQGGETGPDRETELWDQFKYLDRGSDMRIGGWQEARLIEAEVLLGQDDVAEAVARMNEGRAAVGLDPLDPGMSETEARDALRRERRHELFLEARRFADMRRYGLFPDGWGATCIPISRTERDANPNI